MLLFFRLPFVLLELVLRQGLRGLGTLVRLLRGQDAGEAFGGREPARPERGAGFATVTDLGGVATGAPTAQPPAQEGALGGASRAAVVEEPAPPTAAEAIRRRRAREAVDQVAPPVTEPEPSRPLPTPGEEDHVDTEPTLVESFGPEEEVAGALTVDEPWDGYDGMPATAVVARLRGADAATKGVVRLYEQTHKKRQTILRATG